MNESPGQATTRSRVYRSAPPEGREWVPPEDEGDFETFLALEGRPQPAWRLPAMELLRFDDKGRPLRPAGMPWLGVARAGPP